MSDYFTLNDPLNLILRPDSDENQENCNDSLANPSVPSKEPCQTCHSNEWKYKCPKCEFLSCSLICTKSHKEKYNCDGIRSKISYIPQDKYGYRELMSGQCQLKIFRLLVLYFSKITSVLLDYVWLEDISRVIDSAHRTRIDQKHVTLKFKKRYSKKSQKRWSKLHKKQSTIND
ncbi:7244_t:CDS:2 [Acaulospora morrowiae]|uniref:Box C/D snoRNA protein 1 n=1 Tax=Acaulospora morrowiae TaxID=94023 RepID=A0A9N9ABJ0_9GLOM|nr:7244_t:CDS:2 [Acaulospora morrowiae]